ncbi:hypothetical protein [Labilithrix luteola]|nr:hypothetical protein [Labilithrix luteola]
MALARVAVIAFALAAGTLAIGCSAESSDVEAADEQALTTAKTLTKGISSPTGLAVTSTHVYFGSNHFVASGDPELDQQMAYWEGKYSRVGISGGRREVVTDIGPITNVRTVGSKLYFRMSGGCWISAVDTTAATIEVKPVYTQSDCGEYGLTDFEVTNDALVVLNFDGPILRGKPSGSDMTQIADLRIGTTAPFFDAAVLADGALYVLSTRSLFDNQNHSIPQALYRVGVEDGVVTKLFDVTSSPSNVVSDGKNVFWTEKGTDIVALAAGSNQPKTIATGLRHVVELAADGTNVYAADSERNAIYVVKDALGTPKKKKLADAKGVQAIAVDGDKLYFATDAYENNKPAGIIGVIKLPQ